MTENQQSTVNNPQKPFYFTREEQKKISEFVQKKDKKGLDQYLESNAEDLLKRGAIAKYLYNLICYQNGLY